MKIVVVGAGYVGLSNAALLARHNQVTLVDINAERIGLIQAGHCPIQDTDLEAFFASDQYELDATTDSARAFQSAELIIIATPTNYDPETGYFDTSIVGAVLRQAVELNQTAALVIKSTIPVGYIKQMRQELGTDRVIFSPEFLREGKALYDNLHPSRIVIGDETDRGRMIAALFIQGAKTKDVPVLLTGPDEAEAIKLFANTYLAMRVAFFNELDSFAACRDMNAQQIIEGVSHDPRVGNHYNNPSFGYGGYCLPKDTKQLLVNFSNVPQNLIKAIVEANDTRKQFIADQISAEKPQVVGIYRLVMKVGSDNFRESSIIGVIERLLSRGQELVIYEPSMEEQDFLGIRIEKNLEAFKSQANLIIANRPTSELDDVRDRTFTRDLFGVL